MLFMFFQFIICLRIKFLLSVEACHISKFWSGVVHVLVINKRIFHNDDRHETSLKRTREHLVVIKIWKRIQKFIYAIKKVFVEKRQKFCAIMLKRQQLWSQRWQGQNFFWLMLHFISNFLDLLTVCEYQIITASLKLDTNQ